MNSHRTPGAVLATLAVALLLSACSDDPSTSDPSAAGTTTATSPSSAGQSTTSPSATVDAAGYQRLGETSRVLDPGRWAVTPAGRHGAPLAVLDVPEGLNGGAEYVWSNDGWILGYWTVGGIYVDPCTRTGGVFDHASFPDLWAEALAAQRRTTTSAPAPVTIDGYDGLHLKLTAPQDVELDKCRQDRLTVFETTVPGDNHWIADAGVVEHYWLLDVNGQRVVLTGAVVPGTTDSQVDQLIDIVESVHFVRS